jgi:hypothetical protein
MQHRKEPALVASLDRGRPGVGSGCAASVCLEVEYVNHAFPYGRALKRESPVTQEYLRYVVPSAQPAAWLKKATSIAGAFNATKSGHFAA